MLYSYYDCTQSHKFQSLFGNLWIGQHPTPLQGKSGLLFLDHEWRFPVEYEENVDRDPFERL